MKTPDEIKTALEVCASGAEFGCIDRFCPYGYLEDEGECCDSVLCVDALAYIQTIEQENFSLKQMLRDADKHFQQLEAQVPKWISFREALPPAHQRVLCLGTDKGKPYVYIDLTLSFGCTAYSELYAPTHWMPLPEPPEV